MKAYTAPSGAPSRERSCSARANVASDRSTSLALTPARFAGERTDPTGETPLARESSVVRYTLGASYAFERGFRIKLSTELWNFSDEDDDGHTLAVGLHAAFVAAY